MTQPTPAAIALPCLLGTPGAFYAAIRPLFDGALSTRQFVGIEAKLKAFGVTASPLAWVAYGLATSYWETARTMQPVEEVGRGRGRAYGLPGKHGGQIPFGRGDVQLTWDRNYERADRELGLGGTLLASYALALRPDISARIMVEGMREGWFAADKVGCHTFARHLPTTGRAPPKRFEAARRIINGTDHAAQIAALALAFQDALVAGHWGPAAA